MKTHARSCWLIIAVLSIVWLSGAVSVQAQSSFPGREVTLIVPWPAGGGSDTIMRLFARHAKGHLGVPVVVVNQPGGGGAIGTRNMALAKPDGYKVGMVGSGVITVSNAIYIVMGANIGTTVTNTIVSLAHVTRREEFKRAISAATVHDFFNFICVCILLPLELATGILEKAANYMGFIFRNVGGIKFTSPIKIAIKISKFFFLYLLRGASITIDFIPPCFD